MAIIVRHRSVVDGQPLRLASYIARPRCRALRPDHQVSSSLHGATEFARLAAESRR